MHGVQDDPVYRTLRGAVNARTTLVAGFTTVRNLGLMVKTGGYLLDVALQRAIDQGWIDGSAHLSRPGTPSRPTAATSTRRCSSGSRPGIMPLERRRGHRQRRAPRCARACATRSGTAPS